MIVTSGPSELHSVIALPRKSMVSLYVPGAASVAQARLL